MARRKKSESGRKFAAALLPEPQSLISDRLYYGPMLQGLSDALLERGVIMRPVQCLQEYQQEQLLETPPGFYTGVVFLGPLYTAREFIEAVVAKFTGPKVMLDHHFDDIKIHSVRDDSAAGMRLLTEHLVSLGHRRVAYLDRGNPEANPWKREGVVEALSAAGLPALERGWSAGCRDNFGDVATALDWFAELDPRPTAVVCFDDRRALLLLQAAAEKGLRVPEDLSIAGYGDVAVRTGRSEILTSVQVDADQMGRRAAELVAGDPRGEIQSLLVTPKLMARKSTAAPGE
ncbi:MAG: LacI family DNA-binding transcriptional regulator [Planctomycetota bacterium]|jgi:DNA-binding LacI/PurR family transcriptional regulator